MRNLVSLAGEALPSGLGAVIMERFDLKPGRMIGEIKRRLELAIDREELEPHHEADYYVAYLEREGVKT